MIDIDHPLRTVIERHWPIPSTNDPIAAELRRRTIDDLIQDLDDHLDALHRYCGGDW